MLYKAIGHWENSVQTPIIYGPIFTSAHHIECEIHLVIEGEDDKPKNLRFRFTGVTAYRLTHFSAQGFSLRLYGIDSLVEFLDTPWLEETIEITKNSFDVEKPLRHFRMCFDEAPCYEFLCNGFEILRED